MLVNFGGAIGPLLAVLVRENRGIAYVLVMSSITTFALLVGTLVFFREPRRPADLPPATSMVKVLADMGKVFANGRFMMFLVIFSGFWIMFWQIFYSLPFSVRDVLGFSRFEVIETVDAWTIIFVTVPATALAKKLRPIAAMTFGFALATVSWFITGTFPTLPMTVVRVPGPAARSLCAAAEAGRCRRLSSRSHEIACVDLETTGGHAVRDRVIEAGIVLLRDGAIVGEYSTLVNPGIRIPREIQQFTGITEAMVADAPPFAEVADELMARLEGRLFVAHNARFDVGFLRSEFKRLGRVFRPEVMCTVKPSRALYPQHHRHGLDAVIERHGLVCTARHRALGDPIRR